MMKLIKVKEVVEYAGHSLSANGSVNFTVKASYSELSNSILLMQMLNNEITLKAKVPNEKPFKLGAFMLKQIVIDGDGESTIKLNGLNDYIEMDNLNQLPKKNDDVKEFSLLFEAEVDLEEESNDE